MTKGEIVEKLARERFVERMVETITRQHDGAERHDLTQIVYTALLMKPDETIQRAEREGWIRNLAVEIIKRQYRLDSPFNRLYRKYQRRNLPIPDGLDIADESTEASK